jgi:hypothetical protein
MTDVWRSRAKKIGFTGFLFFLLKGLAWIVAGYFLLK